MWNESVKKDFSPPTNPQSYFKPEFLTRVNRAFEQYYGDPHFGIQQVASCVCLSPSQLYRRLRAETGLSPSLYLRSLRLQKAHALLEHTDLPVMEIAYQVGFSDPAYFSRTFKQMYGQSPAAFRKMHK